MARSKRKCCLNFRIYVYLCVGVLAIMFIITMQMLQDFDTEAELRKLLIKDEQLLKDRHPEGAYEEAERESIPYPIMVWWTGFTKDQGSVRNCGNVKCYSTMDRHYQNHPQTKVFLFYGTDFKPEDLPLPRKPHHEWALLHEESPKNQFLFSHEEVMTLFNHTSTFKRESDYPITTQYLTDAKQLESKEYLVSTQEKNQYLMSLAPINYVYTDCDVPSDRDNLFEMLSRHIKIDSYGACKHNRDLPKHLVNPIEGMEHKDFYRVMAKYKFTLATENAVCDDYITEKIWRPLMLGSVPVILGSPKIKDFLPTNKSAILVSDFKTVQDLAKFITFLNNNDQEYEKYLSFKTCGIDNQNLLNELRDRPWGTIEDTTKPSFVEGFECFVCKRLHENLNRLSHKMLPKTHIANASHYGCPAPLKFMDTYNGNLKQKVGGDTWYNIWLTSKYSAKALLKLVEKGKMFSENTYMKMSEILQSQDEL